MRVLELFGGYGSQALALENLGIEFTSDISEIDKYAIQAYNQLHGETHNWGDITKIDETKLPYYDLITYSSPCQDFSVAGLQKGGDFGSGTRSSLLWECERIIRAVKPKYLLMENVKNLVGKKHKHNFVRWLNTLEMMGYQNFWQVLNAKDYGVPQNRERVFVVSIRKDVDTKGYKFPEKIPLTRKLKDVLEPVVNEKYYLSQDKVDKLVMNMDKEISNTIRCGGGGSLDGKHTWDIIKEPQLNCLGNIYGLDSHGGFGGDVFDENGISRTIMADGGNRTPYICASRGRNPENPSDRTAGASTEQRLEVNQTGCSNTTTTVEKDNYLLEPQVLTPKRNEYGKAVRKEYEAGNFTDSRHNMTDMQPRVDGVSNTLTTVNKDNYVIQVGNLINTDSFGGNPQAGRVYSTDDVSPTLNTMQGGQREPKILSIGNVYESKGQNGNVYDVNGICPTISSGVTNTKGNGGIGSNNSPKIIQQAVNTDKDGCARTICSNYDKQTPENVIGVGYGCTGVVNSYRIRKLTPLECWRLMGVRDEDFNKLHGISNTQLYKMAANSIVVDVLMGIFKNLFLENDSSGQLSLF